MNKELLVLISKVREFYASSKYQIWKKTMRKFPSYCTENIFRIKAQNSDATLVASERFWKTLGRELKYSARAIVLSNGKRIYDISDTFGQELPYIDPLRLDGNVDQFYDIRKAVVMMAELPVEETCDNTESANGWVSWSGGKIVVKSASILGEKQYIKTLIHELAHSIYHNPRNMTRYISDVVKEVEAEMFAHIVLNRLGIDSTDYSIPYIALWINDNTKDCSYIMENAYEMIVRGAEKIANKIKEEI